MAVKTKKGMEIQRRGWMRRRGGGGRKGGRKQWQLRQCWYCIKRKNVSPIATKRGETEGAANHIGLSLPFS